MNRHEHKRDPFLSYSDLSEIGWYASSSGTSYSAYSSTPHGSVHVANKKQRHVERPDTHAMSLQFEKPKESHVPNRLTLNNRRVESMEQHKYGRFAEAAYHWRDKDRSMYYEESFAHVREASGFKLDNTLSSLRTSVFHNATTGETVFTSRGTDPRSLTDLLVDVDIANMTYNEKNDSRFKSEDARLKATIKKYGRTNLSLTGHSLGGSLVIQLSRDNDVPAYAFNPGISLQSAMDKNHQSNASKIHIFVTKNDPVSIGRHAYRDTKSTSITYVSQKNKIDPHGPDNFLSKENQNTDGTFDDVHGVTYETVTDTVEKLGDDRYHLFNVVPIRAIADAASFVESLFTSGNDDESEHVRYTRDGLPKGDNEGTRTNVTGPVI